MRMLLLPSVVQGAQAGDLRSFAPDRPGVGENPVPVDKGHFQVELQLLSWTRDQTGNEGLRSDEFSSGFNVKYGLSQSSDLQAVMSVWDRTRVVSLDSPGSDDVQGFKDLELRYKQNCWGADGGPSAFAVMPFLLGGGEMPGKTPQWLEGGLLLPLTVNLPAQVQFSTMLEWDWTRASLADDYHSAWLMSASAGHDLGAGWGTYVEVVSANDASPEGSWQPTLGAGFTWQPSDFQQWDISFAAGMLPSAPDLNIELGYAFKIP
jgi:hypothetical protein